jgi:hypothetical protein
LNDEIVKKNHFKKLVKEKTIAIKRMGIPNKDEIVKKKTIKKIISDKINSNQNNGD